MNISEHKLHYDTKFASVEGFEFDFSCSSEVAQIKVFNDLSKPCSDWTEFETTAIHTVFQTYAWLSAWHKHIGSKAGIRPQIIIGYSSDGSVQFILPLAIKSIGPLRILCFLGCAEASYQIGMYAPGFAAGLTQNRVGKLMQEIKTLLPKFHVMRFKRQPFEWQGMDNPFAHIAHKPAPSSGYAIRLQEDYQSLYAATRSWKSQSKIVRRERKMEKYGEIDYRCCASEEETSRVLDIMFAQKEKRFCEQGIANFLARPGVQSFYRELCHPTQNTRARPLGLHYYACGDQVLAIIMSAPYRDTEFGLINSMSDGPLRHYSPGLHALHRDIERLCTNKTKIYDLGVGAHNYKDLWTDTEYPLFDTILPTSLMGYLYAYGSGFLLKIKRDIKNSKILWPAFLIARARIYSLIFPDACPPINETI